MIHLLICITQFIVFSIVLSVEASDIPMKGWRYPNETDMTGDWKAFQDKIPKPYHVKADFNGDGLMDEAWILIKTEGKGWGLFIFLSKSNGGLEIIKLDEEKGDMPPQRMGIVLVSPSDKKYKTACGKGYWECKPGEPEELQISLSSIDYFMYGSANSIYMWDTNKKSFKRIWMSD